MRSTADVLPPKRDIYILIDNVLRAWHGGCRWRILSCLPRTVALVVKALTQALWLLAMLLFWMPSPDVILLQVSHD